MTVWDLLLKNSEEFQGSNSSRLKQEWDPSKWGSWATIQIANEASPIMRHLNNPEKSKTRYKIYSIGNWIRKFRMYLLGHVVLSKRHWPFLFLVYFSEFKYLYHFHAHLLHAFPPSPGGSPWHINQMIYGPSADKTLNIFRTYSVAPFEVKLTLWFYVP